MFVNWQLITQINSKPLLTWANSQTLSPELFNGSPTRRMEKWWGKSVKLLNYGKSWQITQAPAIASVPILQDLCDRFYQNANSVLLYYYAPGVGIGDHTDKPVFSPDVVLINLIDAQADLFGDKPTVNFRLDRQVKTLRDGDVIRFHALTPHGLPPVKVPRYSISFRVV